MQANEKADRQARSANILDVQFAEVFIKDRPVDVVRQTIKRMAAIEDLIQPGAEQIALINYSSFRLHEITGK